MVATCFRIWSTSCFRPAAIMSSAMACAVNNEGACDLNLGLGLRPLPALQPPLRELGEKPVGRRVALPGGCFEAFPELFVDADVLADRSGHGRGSLCKANALRFLRSGAHSRRRSVFTATPGPRGSQSPEAENVLLRRAIRGSPTETRVSILPRLCALERNTPQRILPPWRSQDATRALEQDYSNHGATSDALSNLTHNSLLCLT